MERNGVKRAGKGECECGEESGFTSSDKTYQGKCMSHWRRKRRGGVCMCV